MEGLKPPSPWSMDTANMSKSWNAWKEEFSLYVELAMPEAEEKTRVKLFYYLIGEQGRALCQTLIGTEPRVTVSRLMSKFDDHCNPNTRFGHESGTKALKQENKNSSTNKRQSIRAQSYQQQVGTYKEPTKTGQILQPNG